MDKSMKMLLTVLMIMYIVSPMDAMPGPVDDMLVFVIGMAARKALTTS